MDPGALHQFFERTRQEVALDLRMLTPYPDGLVCQIETPTGIVSVKHLAASIDFVGETRICHSEGRIIATRYREMRRLETIT